MFISLAKKKKNNPTINLLETKTDEQIWILDTTLYYQTSWSSFILQGSTDKLFTSSERPTV